MGPTTTLALLSLVLEIYAQHIGTLTAEVHPSLAIQQCTLAQGCQTIQKSVVLDANLRWTHRTDGYTDCYTGNTWDPVLCDNNPVLCAQSCAVDGADYPATYGITTAGTSISLRYVTEGQYQRNVGSRVFLLDDNNNYMQFRLANREFTFDVDLSQMPCGTNGALYFVDMHRDGGLSAFPDNRAGARYGTGYCDSQCSRDLKWIDGEANSLNWTPYTDSKGKGHFGGCCAEVDLLQGNAHSSIWATHASHGPGPSRCADVVECGDRPYYTYDGIGDKDGCEFNTYRLGNPSFYGPNAVINTDLPFTVITQFITENGDDNSIVVEVRRVYKQNGVVIPVPPSNIVPAPSTGLTTFGPYDTITDQYCHDIKTVFNDVDMTDAYGGLQHTVLPHWSHDGLVLAFSISDDDERYMEWLDTPPHGPCAPGSGVPQDLQAEYPTSRIQFSNIKYGEIGSTY
ncbi:glycoside hydrolase family 7 protein [Pleurotus ostreatus PC15]|uniref:Glucanase n=1 Tax=Pleurotus ostreatus (strain PC15) TaxID=1137138 RepID=A0A067NVF8_PLEO1|nr:glycoside hydrolase family 7 protein [Pleurotus ostreatus PC15]